MSSIFVGQIIFLIAGIWFMYHGALSVFFKKESFEKWKRIHNKKEDDRTDFWKSYDYYWGYAALLIGFMLLGSFIFFTFL